MTLEQEPCELMVALARQVDRVAGRDIGDGEHVRCEAGSGAATANSERMSAMRPELALSGLKDAASKRPGHAGPTCAPAVSRRGRSASARRDQGCLAPQWTWQP